MTFSKSEMIFLSIAVLIICFVCWTTYQQIQAAQDLPNNLITSLNSGNYEYAKLTISSSNGDSSKLFRNINGKWERESNSYELLEYVENKSVVYVHGNEYTVQFCKPVGD